MFILAVQHVRRRAVVDFTDSYDESEAGYNTTKDRRGGGGEAIIFTLNDGNNDHSI